jgi:predicted nucleic-acid-binding protein
MNLTGKAMFPRLDGLGRSLIVSGLLTTEQLRVESAELVWRAKRRYEASKADSSDALIAECSVAAGCKPPTRLIERRLRHQVLSQ